MLQNSFESFCKVQWELGAVSLTLPAPGNKNFILTRENHLQYKSFNLQLAAPHLLQSCLSTGIIHNLKTPA